MALTGYHFAILLLVDLEAIRCGLPAMDELAPGDVLRLRVGKAGALAPAPGMGIGLEGELRSGGGREGRGGGTVPGGGRPGLSITECLFGLSSTSAYIFSSLALRVKRMTA